jgi:lipopolysaccharide/colanic/teichoic acid biosynthesis glycosyltransferase
VLSLVALPVILLLAVGVAASLRAWPFFVQRRPGWQGRTFTIIKLRTLPPATPHYAMKDVLGIESMRLPKLCAALRRTHLDELPQLFAVVTGRMSLVGPRPLQPIEIEPVEKDFETLRRSVRPGCTGLWQLSVAASDKVASAPRFDIFYVNYASTLLDLWIVARTVGWVLGLVEPIDLGNIPRRLLGPGLGKEFGLQHFSTPEPEPEVVGWVRPKTPVEAAMVPDQEVYPSMQPAFALHSLDGVLAEVAD